MAGDLLKSSAEKLEVLKRIQEILKEYDGKESDIPLNHNYWNLVNQYRGMK